MSNESYAKANKLTMEDLCTIGMHRHKALADYAAKKAEGGKMIARLPLAMPEGEREALRAKLAKDGVVLPAKTRAPPKGRKAKAPKTPAAKAQPPAPKFKEVRILPDDSPTDACIKAEKLAYGGMSELSESEILKKFGRDIHGKRIK